MEVDAAFRLGVFVAVLTTFVLLETAFPARVRTHGTVKRTGVNALLFVLGAGLVRLIAPLGLAGVAIAADALSIGLFNAVSAPALVVWLVCLLTLDAALYAQHRAMHRFHWLWRWHAAHHADPDLDASSGLRFHPGEYLISFAWKAGVVMLLGAPVEIVIAFEIALNAFSIFNHANVRLPAWLERALAPIVFTPTAHRLHHDADAGVASGNYGFSIVLWDRVFGTYSARPEPRALGLSTLSPHEGAQARAMLVLPFVMQRDVRPPA